MEACIKEKELALMESDIQQLFKQLSEAAMLTKAVYELTSELRITNQSIDVLTKSHDQVRKDVDELKFKPTKRWDNLVQTLIVVVASGIVGGMIARIL